MQDQLCVVASRAKVQEYSDFYRAVRVSDDNKDPSSTLDKYSLYNVSIFRNVLYNSCTNPIAVT